MEIHVIYTACAIMLILLGVLYTCFLSFIILPTIEYMFNLAKFSIKEHGIKRYIISIFFLVYIIAMIFLIYAGYLLVFAGLSYREVFQVPNKFVNL